MQNSNSIAVKTSRQVFWERLLNLANTFADVKAAGKSLWVLLQEKVQEFGNSAADIKSKSAFVIKANWKKPEVKKKIGKFALLTIVILIVLVGVRFVLSRPASSNGQQLGATVQNTLTTSIEREFNFKVYDKNKKLADPVKYVITTAQLTNQIIIQGQKATAVAGRNFLIINLKLVNEFNDSLFLNTRNYIRIQPAGTQDKLAPEIHNDTVEVQPLSTKLTRVGLPVDEGTRNFTLFVGELDGEKTEIPISF